MKITVNKVVKTEREIITPAYYDLGNGLLLAVMEEDSVLRVTALRKIESITRGSMLFDDEKEKMTDKNIMTEEAFFKVYNRIHESLSMKPQLVEK